MLVPLKIRHIVPVTSSLSEEGFTLLQGFSREVIQTCEWIVAGLSVAPLSFLELYATDDEYVALRSGGCSLDVIMVNENLLLQDDWNIDSFFSVIWSSEQTRDSAEIIARRMTYEPIHISSHPRAGDVSPDILSPKLFHDLLESAANKLLLANIHEDMRAFLVQMMKREPRYSQRRGFDFAIPNHNCVRPGIQTLAAFGFERGKGGDGDEPVGENHVSAIIDIASRVDRLRKNSSVKQEHIRNDGIIYCASMYSSLYRTESGAWRELGKRMTRASRNALTQCLVRNKGYSNSRVKGEDFPNIIKDPYLMSVVRERQMELGFFSAAVSVIASSQCATSIRLPNGTMLHHDLLRNMASLLSTSIEYFKPKPAQVINYMNLNIFLPARNIFGEN